MRNEIDAALLLAERYSFSRLCREESKRQTAANGIGEYAEKRMHRTLKRFVLDDPDCFERRVPRRDGTLSRFIADVLTEKGQIFEIQTGSLFPLARKIRFYMEETDFRVTVVHPLLSEKQVTYIEKDGTPLRRRKSPLHESFLHGVAALKPLVPFLGNERLSFRFLSVSAEEYRFARVRAKRRYECFLSALLDEIELSSPADYFSLLPQGLPDLFVAKDFAAPTKLRGYDLYDALAVFCAVGALSKEGKRGRAVLYRKIWKDT